MNNKEIHLLLQGLSFDFIEIPPCSFIMGSSPNECWHRNDELLHSVTLTKKFWIGKNPVAVEQYNRIAGAAYKGDKKPCKVTWYEAQKFCDILNERYTDFLPSGYMFALPTEAQWEYACRAGTETPFNSKDGIEEIAWYSGNAKGAQKVGSKKKANAWGLYDMHGNVAEWCEDAYAKYDGDRTDPLPRSGNRLNRVIRGGNWESDASACRSAARDYTRRYLGLFAVNKGIGFRLALVPFREER